MGKATPESKAKHEAKVLVGKIQKEEYKKASMEVRKNDGLRYAVMRCGGSVMRFTKIHETRESAEAEAVRLLAKCVAEGHENILFSVVKIEKTFGFEDGKFFDVD